jgi:hypothetical protein
MIVHPAKFVIKKMCRYNQYNSGYQQPYMIGNKKLLEYKKSETNYEKYQGQKPVMVFLIPMVQSITTNKQRKGDHPNFKSHIVNDVGAKDREAGHKKREQGAMNSTGQ